MCARKMRIWKRVLRNSQLGSNYDVRRRRRRKKNRSKLNQSFKKILDDITITVIGNSGY